MVCVGADLSVRPHSIQRSDENGRTHRSAPTKGYSYRAVCVMDTSSKSCSSFGTKKFQGRNSLVPAEELFSSNGGTFRFLGRNLEVPTEDSGFPTEECPLPEKSTQLGRYY